MARRLRILTAPGALDAIASLVADDGIGLDPVIVDGGEGAVLWHGQRTSIADAAPDLGWFSPEVFRQHLNDHFLRLAADAPSFVWLQSARAGFNDFGLAELVRSGVRLTTSDGPAIAISEYVLAQVLDHFQRGPERREAQAAALWRAFPFREIGNSRWLIYGFGAIGREIARRAAAFGVHVTGVRRRAAPDDLGDMIVTPESMGETLEHADVVILCVPLSRRTDNVADADFFARMKPGSLLVNVGRGGLLDEGALHHALDEGRPGHAVLDVTRVEPLPLGNWMWGHRAVTLTAHTSGWGDGMANRTRQLFADNLRRFVRGDVLRNEVSIADVAASQGL